MCFGIPVEMSFDLIPILNLGIGVSEFMDISNNVGGLGVLVVRAFYLTGK